MTRAKAIALRGYFEHSAVAIATGGYYSTVGTPGTAGRALRIFTHGWINASALALFTFGYFSGVVSFDDSAVVYGSIFGPQAAGLLFGAGATGIVDAPLGQGDMVGPQTGGVIEGPGETWH